MSDLCISPVLKEITSMVDSQAFSSMYFGRHCGKNILVLQHEVTLMLVFGKNDQLRPDFIKAVSSNGVEIKAIHIVGNEDVLLLLDDAGSLWRLINAFESSDEKEGRLHFLDEKCFYEWVPFKKFNFKEVLAVSAWKHGFACLGICQNSERKLLWLPSANSDIVRDCTFPEVRSSNSHLYLVNVRINGLGSSTAAAAAGETLLVTDRSTGKTYMCSEDRRNSLINYSNNFLVSVLHFKQENCLLLGFQNGKLVFHFLNTSVPDSVVYLPRKLSLMQECCCFASCLLWSDSTRLYHTKFTFHCSEPHVKPFHLRLQCNIEKPSHLIKIGKDILAVSINNIYYHVRAGSDVAGRAGRNPEELLSQICEGSLRVHDLNAKIDVISHFLYCKEVMDQSDIKEKVEMSLEQNYLMMKFHMNVVLRRDLWKVRLTASFSDKKYVKMVDLETDVSEGMLVRVEYPFKSRSAVKVSLVGDFDGEGLLVDLGEVGEPGEQRGSDLSKHLKQILIRRNPFCWKEKSVLNFG